MVATGARPRPLPGALPLRTVDDSLTLRRARAGGRVGRGRRRRVHRLRGDGVADRARRPRDADRARAAPLLGPAGAGALGGDRGALPRARRRPAARASPRSRRRPSPWPASASSRTSSSRRDAGLEVRSGVITDERFATSRPGVYAIGDVAEFYDPVFGRRRRIEHWSNAAYHGTTLGQILAGRGRALRHRLVVLLRAVRPYVQALRRRDGARIDHPGGRLRHGRRACCAISGRAAPWRRSSPGQDEDAETALKEEIRAGAAIVRIAVTLAGKRLRRRTAWPTRRSNSSRSTRSAPCRWMRCRRRTPAIPARRWRSRRSPTSSTTEVLRHNPASPHWPDRDRFILSAGHACVLQYSALHLSGYNLSLEELKRFRQWESATPGHPEFRHTEGIEMTTGPLGQGLRERRRHGLRRALPRRHVQPAAPRDRRPPRLRDLLRRRPDGGRLVRGGARSPARTGSASSSTSTTTTTSRSTARRRSRSPRIARSRFEAQGWHVQYVDDVNDLDALRDAIAAAQDETAKPSIVIVRSHIAYGAPKAVDTAKSHGSAARRGRGRGDEGGARLGSRQALLRARRGLRAHERRRARHRARERVAARPSSAGRRRSRPTREKWDAAWDGRIGPWELPEFEAGEEIATRDAGKKVMQAFKHAVPTMIGGAADLVESTKTEFEGGGLFSDRWSGRNIPFGIREHAMGSIVNGIGVHGGCVKPYGSTFLIFSDYMRPAVRLVRADEAAGRLGLDARLGRARRGRPDAPARRDVRRAARDPGPLVHAAGGRERDRARLEGRARAHRRPGRALALAAEGRRRSTAPTSRRRRSSSAAPTRSGSRRSSPDLILIGTGAEVGLTLDGRPEARRGRHRGARRLDAVLGALRGAAGRLPRRGAAARGEGAALDRAGRRARLEQVGRRPRRLDLDRALRRLGARARSREFGYNLDNVVARRRRSGASRVRSDDQGVLPIVAPGFASTGAAAVDRGHRGATTVARVRADGACSIRFTFDEGDRRVRSVKSRRVRPPRRHLRSVLEALAGTT